MRMKITGCPSASKSESGHSLLLLLGPRKGPVTQWEAEQPPAPGRGGSARSLRAALTRPGGRCCLGAVLAPVYPESPAGAGPGTLQPVKEAEDGTEMWTIQCARAAPTAGTGPCRREGKAA